jgi:methanogenic corrinoid protein MtbC1
VTQLIMSQLYPRIAAELDHGRSAVITCVAGELHEVGARMVADMLEMDGWDACYLGASVPADGVVQLVKERLASVLCISATLHSHLSALRELVLKVNVSSDLPGVRILAGGRLFNLAPGLVGAVGAHASARDARGAVEVANQWMQI